MSLFSRLVRALALPSVILTVGFLSPPSAQAGTRISVGSMSVDGLEVHDLFCDVESGGFLASAGIVGALAGQKGAFARCGPEGEAARLSFEFNGSSTTGVKVLGASSSSAGACIAKALRGVKPTTSGTCTATILTVPNAKAKAAAAELSPNKKASAPAKAEPEPKPEPKKAETAKPETAKGKPGKIATDKEAPAKTAEVDTSEAGLLKLYSDEDNWISLSKKSEGWEFWVPRGAEFEDTSFELGYDRWIGAEATHAHQLAWLFRHPTAALTAKVVEDITAHCLAKAKDLKWSQIASKPADGVKPAMIVEQAFLSPHRFVRFLARGTRESVIVLAVFFEQMPDDIVVKWIESVKFWTPTPADVEE